MKPVLIFFIVLSIASTVQAKCYSSGLRFWPISNTIKQNPVFLVDGYADSQAIITGLGTTYQIYLRSGSQQIPLVVREVLVGQLLLTQAVLKPQRTLEPGKQYELVIEDTQNKGLNLAKTRYQKPVIYTVVAGLDKAAPIWKALPKEKAKHYTEMGCGPEVAVEFIGAVHDQSAYVVKATVKNMATGKVTSYYVVPTAHTVISIGHDMCVGAFALEKGKNFSVVFPLLDASGNTTNWTGKAISFSAPAISW